ncbi:MAG TPA: CarD family transcriptional regulator [bacterium]|mgnify:FL=1|nr:CarD family transcriptional regulator [bacterium]
MFKVGDKAVYPAHGVGVIEGVEQKDIGNTVYTFFMLRIIDNDITIMVPTNNAEKVGLRPLISKGEIPKVWKILKDKDVTIDNQTWNRRYREYMEKIKTGSVMEIAGVLRDLYVLRKDKELSYGERKMLETARNLLISELALATSKTQEQILKQLEAIYAD